MREEKEEYDVQTDILQLFDQVDEPVLTAEEVAQLRDSSLQDARDNLLTMEGEGMVQRKHIGDDVAIWWPTARPDIEPETRALLLKPNQEDPLDLDDIREILHEHSG